MIDIREVSKAIAADVSKLDASDAKTAAIHAHVRNYGVALLSSLHDAIVPSNESEIAVVQWLRGEIAKVVKQIPLPTSKKETTT